MRVFVLGAGRMGSVVAKDLDKSPGGVEIGIGDIDQSRAAGLASKLDGATSFKVDVTKDSEGLVRLLKEYDAVVNASWYEYNIQVMKACIEAGCNYNDLGGLFHVTRKQLELKGDARKKGVSAIAGGGESPGITNVLCALAAKELSKVRRIKIFVGAKERREKHPHSNGHPLFFPFSVSTIIDEYSKKPVEYLGGKYVEVQPLSGDEVVSFPSPVRRNTCHYTLHSEPATLPETMGSEVKDVEFKLGVSEEMLSTLKPLIETGLTSDERLLLDGTSISPKQFLVRFFDSKSRDEEEPERTVAIKVIVSGYNARKKAIVAYDIVCGPKDGIRNATAFMTGVAGSIFGQLLAAGKTNGPGVLAPEESVEPSIFFSELEKRGILARKAKISG